MDERKEKGYVDARGEIYRYRQTDRYTDSFYMTLLGRVVKTAYRHLQ